VKKRIDKAGSLKGFFYEKEQARHSIHGELCCQAKKAAL